MKAFVARESSHERLLKNKDAVRRVTLNQDGMTLGERWDINEIYGRDGCKSYSKVNKQLR